MARGTPGWYFSENEIDDHSPSRKDGIDLEKETELRKLYCSFLQDLGMKLKVPQVSIAVAMMLCRRFYMRQSHVKNEWQTIATVSMFLSCKMEETPRLLMDVVVAYEIMYRTKPAAAERIKQKDVYNKQKELIVTAERVLLVTVAFGFDIQLPYKPLVVALRRMEISQNDVAKVAWNFVNDWLRTTLCLQYKPHYIAAGSIYLAAKFHKMKLRSVNGKVWWMEFDVVPQRLEEVIQQMLGLLENRKSVVPSCHKNSTQSTLIKKEFPNSTRSSTASGLTTGDTNDHDLRDNPSLPHKHTCEARREDLKQFQASDSGSSGSNVEDGDSRFIEGKVLVESIQIVSSIKRPLPSLDVLVRSKWIESKRQSGKGSLTE
ncbi:hypothetical protein C5167_014607 [Papaver somniferum]|uniref:Cyclin-like domain-containing protein n=1 Tax=Papaver somniferum TaxID=3469 RepID=A0A4Y7J6S8_PAPSO|nr:cyclin-T1-4-like isoform X1 [Papaver somniferum]XP_026456964.1 cyclin-T1-4-like isoform X1 [Papaver somniferum]RZC55752.1 hypothetical protein C5167_014607 [Papaver somniferum]